MDINCSTAVLAMGKNKFKLGLLLFVLIFLFGFVDNKKRELARQKSELLLQEIAAGAGINEFPEKYFPKNKTVPVIEKLKDVCDFKDRKGNYINDWYESRFDGIDRVSFIYEYYLKCDSLRFIIAYNLGDTIELSYFGMEKLSKKNMMIMHPERQLKY